LTLRSEPVLTKHFLDPSSVSQKANFAAWTPDGPIPESARNFGFCVDFKDLQPGDLVLVSRARRSVISWGIRKVQKKGGYNLFDAQWDHAAVYINSDTICEATRSGVRVASIFSYLGTHKIRVRRNLSLSPEERWGLVVNAIKQGDYAYGYTSILGLIWKASFGYWTKSRSRRLDYPKRAVYCSELYADAHVKACGVVLGNVDGGEATPASLSLDSTLSDVEIKWVRIV
jgi:hypothetical protein